jgi:PAS domain S-box-containing protein
MSEDHSDGPASEELLRLIFESATDYAIFSTDVAGVVTSWNSGAERLLGWPADGILGHTADVIFTPEDRALGAPAQERAQASATGRAEDERWQQRCDGTRFWASGLMMPLENPSRGYVKILRDRTERHAADERLRESEERFRLLATNVPQLVFRTLADGSRTWPSPQWIDFTGLCADASIGFGWLEAVHPDDREATLAAWRAAMQSGDHYSEQRVRRRRDGQWRWHQTRARPIHKDRAGEWVGTMTDVHDLRGLQERQKVLMAELQHRTRNLLAMTQVIARQTLRMSPSLADFQQEFERRLLALGRVQVLITGVDYGNVDLRDLLTAELQAHDGSHMASGRVKLDGPAVLLRSGSAQALGLALHELVTNAVKYGALAKPDGRLDVGWQLRRTPEGCPCARLEWKESGVPMGDSAGVDRRFGYGRELIERALPYQLGAKTALFFEPDGVRCTIEIEVVAEEKNG